MASVHAHILVWLLKLQLKRGLIRSKGDVARMRKLFTPPPFRVPRGVKITPATVGGVAGEWVEGAGADLTMLYLHGGGYFACSAETHRPVTAGFAQQGLRVFVPNYRLAPENRFPAALDDATAVYRGLIDQGILPHEMVVGGESAGGGLALSLLVATRQAGRRLPAAAVVFSPWTDLAATGESVRGNEKRCAMFHAEGVEKAAALYLGDTDARNPLASPLYADLAGLPPLLIHVGADEVLLDDSRRLAERARSAGVRTELKIWPVVPHAWQLAYPFMPEARQSITEAAAFLKAAVPLGAVTR
jgi:monoterpene epsilon-lactone hydrolase